MKTDSQDLNNATLKGASEVFSKFFKKLDKTGFQKIESVTEKRSQFLFGLLILFCCSPIGMMAQTPEGKDDARSSDGKPEMIEIRKAKTGPDGSFVNGSMPDTLFNRYFLDEEGRMYKYFSSYEQAVAHFNGRDHFRKRKDVVEGVIYIRKAPHHEDGFPDHIKP